MARVARLLAASLFVLTAASAAAQQRETCVTCHVGSRGGPLPTFHRTNDWNRSRHAAVGCQSCHGGDPVSVQTVGAHRGVRTAVSAFSTMHPANVARTCALCHPSTSDAYGSTMHQLLVEIGDPRAPTCTTCHGLTVSDVPSPAETEQICASCHRPGSVRSDYPAAMRAALDGLATVRRRADALQRAIDRRFDESTRGGTGVALDEARALIASSVTALHRMDVQALSAGNRAAAARLDTVGAELILANRH